MRPYSILSKLILSLPRVPWVRPYQLSLTPQTFPLESTPHISQNSIMHNNQITTTEINLQMINSCSLYFTFQTSCYDTLGTKGYNACVAHLQPYQTLHTTSFTQHLLMIINPREWLSNMCSVVRKYRSHTFESPISYR